jgi:hypothetical protein
VSRIQWRPSYRLVPSRFPPIGLFERVAAPGDLEAVFAIESLTNERLREEAGQIHLVPPEDRISGPGSSAIMAAFTHLNPEGSRFSDGSYGVYYAARKLDTAVAETAYHRARFLARTREAPMEIDMRCYLSSIAAEMVDIRGEQGARPQLYDPDAYAASQRFGREARAAGANGIVYDSVRHPGGQCIAVFKPRVMAPAIQGPHLCYVWDGERIAQWYEKSELRNMRRARP